MELNLFKQMQILINTIDTKNSEAELPYCLSDFKLIPKIFLSLFQIFYSNLMSLKFSG